MESHPRQVRDMCSVNLIHNVKFLDTKCPFHDILINSEDFLQ